MASAQLTVDKEMSIFYPSVFSHRSLFEIHGSFDESFGTAGDYGVLLQELKSGNALFIRDVLDAATMVGGLSSTPRVHASPAKGGGEGAEDERFLSVPARMVEGICRGSE